MKVIIAGSRTLSDLDLVEQTVCSFIDPTQISEVVSGGAKGVDFAGECFATKYRIPIKRFPADWKQHGKKAGYLRNVEMAQYADALVAIWDGESKGTKHMIDIAREKNLYVYVYVADVPLPKEPWNKIGKGL